MDLLQVDFASSVLFTLGHDSVLRTVHSSYSFLRNRSMGVGRFFSTGDTKGFFQNFTSGGPKVENFVFFPLEIKKTTFFAEIFKIQGVKDP